MNLGQLKTSVGRKFGMDTTGGTDDSNALIDWANQGVLDVLLRTRCYVAFGDMTLTAAAGADYRLDTTILVFIDAHVISGNSTTPFQRLTLPELMEMRRNNTNTGTTRYYAVNGDLLTVYPTPTDTTTVRFYLVPRPTAMATDSNDPASATYGGVPTEYHKALEGYMMWQAAEALGDFSGALEQAYDRRLSRVQMALGRKAGPLPRARLAVRRGLQVPSDPAVVIR